MAYNDPSSTWNETIAGTGGALEVTHAAEAGRVHFGAIVQGHVDVACFIRILDAADTVLWETLIDPATNGKGFSIPLPNIHDKTNGDNAALTAELSDVTSDAFLVFGGFSVP